jgi:hypothetical protein
MSNFPQVGAEHLRRMRAQLLSNQSDPVWQGTVTQVLHMLIDNDLASHRTDTVKPADRTEKLAEKPDDPRKPWVKPQPLEEAPQEHDPADFTAQIDPVSGPPVHRQIAPAPDPDPNPFAHLTDKSNETVPTKDVPEYPKPKVLGQVVQP